MTDMPLPAEYDELRRHVRGTQHARSVPLLVVGALLVNYAVANFSANPVQWRYGAPLAFVLIWALNKLNEQVTGVGAARGDYLVAAGVVFIATNVPFFFTRLAGGSSFNELIGIWVIIVGLALTALSRASRDALLAGAGVLVMASGVMVAAFGSSFFAYDPVSGVFTRSWTILIVGAVGTVLGLTGLMLWRNERAEP